jgi:citrate synthase
MSRKRHPLDAWAGKLRTAVGACYPGSHVVFRGKDLHADLRHLEWVALYLYGITGRHFTPQQVEMVNALWVYTSYPDTRLWNNRIAALAASSRSTPALGISAALAVSDARIYGGQPGVSAMEFLMRMQRGIAGKRGAPRERLLRKLVLEELGNRRIYGYGRPINSVDERIPWLMKLATHLGFDTGPHVALAFEIERILVPVNAHLRMNYAALHAALVADLGLSLKEYQLLRIPTFLAGMPPCFVEAAERPAGTLLPIPCDSVNYSGRGPRPWKPAPSPKK